MEYKYKWFNIWYQDKQSIVATMEKNIAADIDAGYNPFGNSIRKQRAELNEYIEKFDEEVQKLRDMGYKQAEHWCYIDLKRRGAIA